MDSRLQFIVTESYGIQVRRRAFLLICLIACLLPEASIAEDAVAFRDRSVTAVLKDYESRGHRFLYSTGLVRPYLKFADEPPAGAPIDRLNQALRDVGLELTPGDNGVWRIVVFRQASPPRVIKGRVTDAATGEPLSGVRVEIADQVLLTNTAGEFALEVQQPSVVSVSHSGYSPKRIAAERRVSELLEIDLAPQRGMEEIVVVSSRYAVETSKTRSHNVDLKHLQAIPRLGEDPLRITSLLPGMSTIGVSAKPHIRGGSQDELLVLFNNVELLEPFHLRDFRSVFSTFNPSLIESIDVYTGGFPARYGDRMSGVMDISPGRQTDKRFGELSISLLNTSLMLQGTLGDPQEARGDWIVSARRGNLDIVTKEINSTVGEPSYSDWVGQVRWQLDNGMELDFGLIAYNDDIELSDFDTDGEIAESRYRNTYAWGQLYHRWSQALASHTLLSVGAIQHDRSGFLLDTELDNGEATVSDEREFDLFTVSHTFTHQAHDRWFTEFGFRLNYQRASYDYAAQIRRGLLAELLGTQLDETRAFRLSPDGMSGGVFGSVRVQPTDKVSVELGMRWDFQDYAQRSARQFSPRVSLKYDPFESTELRLSAGRFFQPQGINELQLEDGLNRFQREQRADHLIAGWYQTFADSGFSLRVELFSKSFHNPKRRFENVLNPIVLLPELASDRFEVTPAKARAQGIEVTLRYEPNDDFSAWLTLTESDVEDRVAGRWEPRVWDQGNSMTAGGVWIRGGWQFSTSISWHDGWRTTRLPSEVEAGAVLSLARNKHRLRDYFSLDLQISRTWETRTQSFTAFLELTNALNRHNVGGIEYDIEETEEGGFELDPSDETLMPLVPSIGVRWSF